MSADIIVAGDGPVGNALVALLHKHMDVVQLVPEQPTTPPPLHIALGPSARHILKAAGFWQGLAADELGYFERIHVWDVAGAQIHFDAADMGEAALAHTVALGTLCAAMAGDTAHLRVHATPAGAPRVEGQRIHCPLQDGSELEAALLVAADGAASWVRAASHLHMQEKDYEQRAIVCTAQCTVAHAHIAMQVFLPSGPVAVLPLAPAHTLAVIWTSDHAQATRLEALSDEDFAHELQAVFGHRIGTVSCTARHSFPLKARHASCYHADRVALVGDAAHVVHPLAGLGMNLGLQDAAVLADLVCNAKARGRDPGAAALLGRYQRCRAPANRMVAAAIDGLRALFASASLHGIRALGLDLLDNTTICKVPLMQVAAGQWGALPECAQARWP